MSIPGLNDWLETPQGRYVLGWEQARCDLVLADVFGFNAVQLGMPQMELLRVNRMPLRFHCDQRPGLDGVCALPHHLPFASASIDLVVLPHVLEFADFPHQVLREVERVLVPEGQVLITGFNPWSLWGLRRKMACPGPGFPWNGRYLSVARLKDWLTLLGFEIQGGRFGCYAPPFHQSRSLARAGWMELAGDRWWPIFGGVYALQAVKRVHGMRLILPKWRERLARAKALAPAVPTAMPRKTNKT